MAKTVVTGAGGFIGWHLVKALRDRGDWVVGVDIKPPEFEPTMAHEWHSVDLASGVIEGPAGVWFRITEDQWRQMFLGADEIYHLAANMGGIGFITTNHAEVARDNVRMTLNVLEHARRCGVSKVFFASSACVYPLHLQGQYDMPSGLAEDYAHPAAPEEGYGWEKLFSEKLCQWYAEDFGMETRVGRFHNIFGPMGTYQGGREKAPAALCRKVALAEDGGDIEIWGDGWQTRSFLYVDDCIRGIQAVMNSDYRRPLNIGSERLVTIDRLADIIASVAGKSIHKRHNLCAPQGVRGRNSDNTLIEDETGWSPQVSLETGLSDTYRWIEGQLRPSRE